MASIRQNPSQNALPDFRNLGVMARVLMAVNLLALAAAVAGESDGRRALDVFVLSTVLVEPPLLVSLVLLHLAAPLLRRMTFWTGCALVLALVLALTVATHAALGAVEGIGL